jgi:hypothetical protein
MSNMTYSILLCCSDISAFSDYFLQKLHACCIIDHALHKISGCLYFDTTCTESLCVDKKSLDNLLHCFDMLFSTSGPSRSSHL